MLDPQPVPEPAAPSALGRFLDDARAFEADEVRPFAADARAVQHNVGVGVGAVLTWSDHVREHLPHVDLEEIRSLPDLALCLAHAADAASGGAVAGDARALFAEAHALRRLLLASAHALVEASVFTAKDVARLGSDRGAVDAGADCAALAALFEKRAADLLGKTPVTAAHIGRAAEVGAELRALLKPRGPSRRATPGGASAAETRDRLWTLLCARHERLWAVGAYVYGRAVDDHVPAITAPVAAPKGRKPPKPGGG